ncbi:endonuclease domain-containing protein [Kitasatospora nipponensis]
MLADQGSCCAVCGLLAGDRALQVDHCHTTGRVRGLLCRKCNSGIGMLGDSPEGVQRALSYLLRT